MRRAFLIFTFLMSIFPIDSTQAAGRVDILAWPGYIERGENEPDYDWVTAFEKETGCLVNVQEATTSDEMVSLMAENPFDLVTASGDASLRLIEAGSVQPVDLARISNYANVDERLKDAPWYSVDGKAYGVPYQWGPNVLIYNTIVFPETPRSWSIVFEEQTLPDGLSNKGRVQAYDSAIYIADAALYLSVRQPELGIKDPYALDQRQYEAVLTILGKQREIVSKYWHNATVQTEDFIQETTVASSSWPYQVNVLKTEGYPVASTIPAEGATGWADTTMLGANAQHIDCAYLWMQHSLDPKVQGDVAAWFGSVPAVPAACEGNDLLGEEGCKNNGFENFDEIRFWRTPGTDCGDTRGNICVPYRQWVTDYLAIIGGR